MASFHRWVEERDRNLVAFFENRWNEELTEDEIKHRSQKPTYHELQNGANNNVPRRTLNALVFDALGSTVNPEVLVVLEDEINNYKQLLWNLGPTMQPKPFETALENAIKGAGPSSVYLTAIRAVFGVFSYLKTPAVHERIIQINKDVIKELGNAVQLTGDPVAQNLAPMWQTFLTERFDKIGNSAKTWTQESMHRAQNEIKIALIKYEKMFRERKEAEQQATKTGKSSKGKGKGPASYAEEQKKKQKALSTELTQKYKHMRTTRADIRKLRAEQKANSKVWTESQRKDLSEKIKMKKEAEKKAEEAVGLTKREIHELYSHSVKMIIKNLKKDQQHLLNFEKKLHTLTMPHL